MNTRSTIVSICAVALFAAAGLAQGTAPAKPAETPKQPATPAAKPTTPPAKDAKPGEHGAGASEAAMAQMMQKCAEAGTPGDMHAWLATGAGTWNGECTMFMPGMPPTKSTCVTTITSFMDGRFVKGETKGEMEWEGQKMPFTGFMIAGYNNTTKQFEQTWIDSMGTMMMNSVGKVSEDKKTLTWTSHYTCPVTEKPVTSRMIETRTGADTMTLEMWGPNPLDGKEMKCMEIKYTRTAGAPTQPAHGHEAKPAAAAPAPSIKPAGK